MKRVLLTLAASGLIAAWVGCGSTTDTTTVTDAAPQVTEEAPSGASSELTLVTLKVPNMT